MQASMASARLKPALRRLMYLRLDLFQRSRPAARNLVRQVILTVGKPFGLMLRQGLSAASVERVAGTLHCSTPFFRDDG